MTTDAAAAARTTIEVWFLTHEADLGNPSYERDEASPEQLASLGVALNAAGVSASWLTEHDVPGERSSPGGWAIDAAALLATAVGTCFGRVPTVRKLMAAERLVWSTGGWAAFSAAVAAEVGSDVPKLSAIATCLQELVHAFTWAPRRIIVAHGDNMCALVERYRLQPRIDDLWSSESVRIVAVKYAPAFDALRLLDQGLYLQLLDAFQHPEPSQHILGYSANLMDLDALLTLFALAPPCFESGEWLPWVKTPVLILAAVEAKLEMIADLDENGASATSGAFVAAVAKAVRGVLERADGHDLGHAWLQQMIRRRKLGYGRRSGDKQFRLEHHGRLLLELASALSPKRCAIDWIRAEQETWRRDRAVAAIATTGLGKTGSQDAAAALIVEVLRLGLWTTAQQGGFSQSSNPERHLMAAVIGRHDAPAAWFDELWRNLAPVRDRARHATTLAGGHAADATMIAVTWFLFGLDAVDVRTPAHRALWRSLHLAVRECAMAQILPIAQLEWRARYGFLAAHLAHRLVTFGDEGTLQDLRDILGTLLHLEMTLAEVVAVLFTAGVEPTVIAVGSGRPAFLVGLLQRLETEQAWREASQEQQFGGQPPFSQVIARIVCTIGGVALVAP